MMAACEGHADVVDELLKHDAWVDTQNSRVSSRLYIESMQCNV